MLDVFRELTEAIENRQPVALATIIDVQGASPARVGFKDLVKEEGLRLDYLNGRLCSAYVQRKGNRYFFDANRFEQDRGSAEFFLALVKQRLEGCSKNEK